MTKIEKDEKKVKESKKNSKAAEKKARSNKLKKEADKMLMNIAADMPGNGGKFLIECARQMDKLNAENEKIRLAKKSLRAKMKGEKVVLEVFDAVMKMRKREPEEQQAFRATEALYTEQLEMYVSPQQKEQLEKLQKQKDDAKLAMDEISGGDSGKEVGSGPKDREEDDDDVTGIPAKNEALTASAVTH